MLLDHYPGGVWGIDFEFYPQAGREGNPPAPVCMVAKNFCSGQSMRLWQDDLERQTTAPFPTDHSALVVAFYASAEASCFRVLGWPPPANVLDLYVAFRMLTNGRTTPCGNGLLGALAWFGLPSVGALEKDSMRSLALRGADWTPAERVALLDYCESDVLALEALFAKLQPHIDKPRILLHGRYTLAAAEIELAGVPIDVSAFEAVRNRREELQRELIRRVDADYGVFQDTTFKQERFAQYLKERDMQWPIHPSGALDLSDGTFKDMCRTYPGLEPLRQTRKSLAALRDCRLQIGDDGRNRSLLSMYRSTTGRNQPSNSKSIFGQPAWMRGFIQPRPGQALAYLDWCQQEFGIAAALSGDQAMLDAYRTGDPYLAFAVQAGAVPPEATKHTHKKERDQFKACVLAVQYGMAAESLAHRIGQPTARANQLLHLHRSTYSEFWRWSEGVLNQATLGRKLWTVFGWPLHVTETANARSLCNFPMQANGAEMMRLACIRLTQDGIKVCAPVHDAILIEAPDQEIEQVTDHVRQVMSAASSVVLAGFALNSDTKIVRHPERLIEDRGTKMWDLVMDILNLHDLKVSPA